MCKIRDLFTRSMSFRYYKTSQLIPMWGHVGLIRDGVISISSVTQDGGGAITQVLGKGGLLNVCGDPGAIYQAVTNCVIQFVPIRQVDKDDPETLRAMLCVAQESNKALINHIVNLSGKPVKDKLKWALNELEAKGYAVPVGFNKGRGKLPLLAGMIGADECTVSRALKKLRFVSYDTQTGSHRHD